MDDDSDVTQEAQTALETAIEDASQKASAEAEAKARADERQAATEARIQALETRGNGPQAFDPSSITSAIETAVATALAPVMSRLDGLETSRQESASVQAQAEPEPESDPFKPQIDYAAIASKQVEKMPRISHPLFRRMLGR